MFLQVKQMPATLIRLRRTVPLFQRNLLLVGLLWAFAFPLQARPHAPRDTSLWHVSQLRIKGTRTLSNHDLRSVLRLTPSFLRQPIFSKRGLRADSALLVQAYRSYGFLKSSVTVDPLKTDSAHKKIHITFRIREGPRTKIAGVHLQSPDSSFIRPVLKKLSVKPGSPLMAVRIQQDVQYIEQWLGDGGYLQPRVGYELAMSDDSLSADVRYVVSIGPQIHVQSIAIDNPPSIRKAFIAHQLTFKKGKVLSLPKIRTSTNNLYATDLFRLAMISYDSLGTDSSGRPDSSYRIVRIKTIPKEFFSIDGGVGFNSSELALGKLTTAYSNFFRLGVHGSLTGYASYIQQRAEIGLAVPWVFLLPFDFDTRLSYTHRDDPKLKFAGTFGELRTNLAAHWSTFSNLIVTHRLQSNNVTRSTVPDSLGNQFLNSIGLAFSLDRRNDVFNPSNGFYFLTSTEWSGIFGGDRFVKQEVDLRGYGGIFRSRVASMALRAGIAVPYGTPAIIPVQERFFLGGYSVMRGFGEKELGPADSSGHPTGGTLYLALNVLELRYPIYKWVWGTIFFDAGNLWDVESTDFGLFWSQLASLTLHYNAGLGFQVQTPVLVVGVEAGFKLDQLNTKTPYAVHVNIGQAF